MFALFCFVLAILASPFKSNSRIEAENAALRHQLIVLRRKAPGANNNRWFLVQLYPWFPSILQVITIFKPATIDGGIGPSLANGVGNLAPWEGGPDRDRPPCTDPADEHRESALGARQPMRIRFSVHTTRSIMPADTATPSSCTPTRIKSITS